VATGLRVTVTRVKAAQSGVVAVAAGAEAKSAPRVTHRTVRTTTLVPMVRSQGTTTATSRVAMASRTHRGATASPTVIRATARAVTTAPPLVMTTLGTTTPVIQAPTTQILTTVVQTTMARARVPHVAVAVAGDRA